MHCFATSRVSRRDCPQTDVFQVGSSPDVKLVCVKRHTVFSIQSIITSLLNAVNRDVRWFSGDSTLFQAVSFSCLPTSFITHTKQFISNVII